MKNIEKSKQIARICAWITSFIIFLDVTVNLALRAANQKGYTQDIGWLSVLLIACGLNWLNVLFKGKDKKFIWIIFGWSILPFAGLVLAFLNRADNSMMVSTSATILFRVRLSYMIPELLLYGLVIYLYTKHILFARDLKVK